MSYYRGSTMSGRGRGYSSRGSSYRGSSSSYRGGGSSYRGSTSYTDRGSFSSTSTSRGRYPGNNSSSFSTSFDSRSRYPAASTERYPSSTRGRDDNYRRPSSTYRPEGPYSSSRDHSRGSPDRKRLRTDQGSSSRRSDVGYGGGGSGDYSAPRYENTSTYGNSDRRYNTERPRSPKDFRLRDTSYRKPESSMPPPSSLPPRRGSFRGRISSRGARGRGSLRRSDVIGRRRINDTYHIRRRVISTKTHDYARRLKIQKMRSSLKKRASGSSPDLSEKEEDWDAEMEEEEEKKKKKIDESAVTEKEVVKPKTTPKKEAKATKTGGADEATDKEDNAASGDEVENDEKKTPTTKSGEKLPRSRYTGRSFIRLTCTQCTSKCVTFKEYAVHLHSTRHINAMRRLALKQKAQLARMRLSQRNAQRDIDEKAKESSLRTQFCPLCKLNYRQLKAKHQTSEAHRNMKKFLMPYCRICHITFKSPMLYEGHMCSLEHIKRKAREGLKNGPTEEVEATASGDDDDDEIKELDLENFMTLDSVGDVDEVDDENDDEDTEKDGSEDKVKTPKVEINVGNEHVKKVEVYYCELCRMYLPRKEELEAALKKHCRTRSHLQKYVRYRDDKALRRQAERIHRKNQEAKEAKEKDKAEKTDDDSAANTSAASVEKETVANESLVENGSVADEEETGEDKLWADVDKDLGELLREVEPSKSSDDEDDSRAISGRYDRFKYSDKKEGVPSEEKSAEIETEASEIATKSDKESPTEDEVTDSKEEEATEEEVK